MSRQTDYQKRHAEQGLCWLCSEPVYLSGRLCKRHRDKTRKHQRDKQGCKAWERGGMGRPPLEAKQ